jgi:DNA-binding NarL/FixJ family response regulator
MAAVRRNREAAAMIKATVGNIRILIADDHPLLREGVAAVIAQQPDMEVTGEAADGHEALKAHRRLRPDITLMDLQMPHMNGVDAIIAIRKEAPFARIIVLTTYSGDAQAIRALKAGASAYLLKNTLRRELVDAIRAVHAGRRHLPVEIASAVALGAIDEPLSQREIEVLQSAAAGYSNKRIAAKLGVSEETVKAHMKNIFAKLRVTDRTHAVATAARRGIIEL